MSEIITVGLDLAKNVFQAHGADASGRTVLVRVAPANKMARIVWAIESKRLVTSWMRACPRSVRAGCSR